MELEHTGKSGLPDNAYRELAPGEEYKPVMPATGLFAEVTPWSLLWGLLMAVVFSAAAAYSGLKIGQVLEAAIPISIMAVGSATFFKKKNMLGQNVIIQSIGASSGVIVAGAVFTIPALYILGLPVNFFQIFLSSLFGGFLGILFLIPFRKYFVKDMHGKFPFPEATATTEILITGERGGAHAGALIASGIIGGLYDFAFSAVGLWNEVFTSRVLPWGTELADRAKMLFQLNVSSMIFGFGYLVGLRFSAIITIGSLLSWWVLIPLINEIGNIVAGLGGFANPIAAMQPEAIFTAYVRPIGIGAIAMAGIIGILKSSKVIGAAFGLAFGGLFSAKKAHKEEEPRTQKDLSMTYVVMFSLLTILGIFIFLATGFELTVTQAIVALLTVVIVSFLFTTVAANAIAIVGSNPVSGMTLMTLILSSIVLTKVGLTGNQGMLSALIIGGIVCTALSTAGGFITDLKIGYWLGSTPRVQQSFKFLGVLVSAATVGAVIFILNQAYGFVPDATHTQTLVAPQANAMAAVIKPLMSPNAQVPWMLYFVGAVIAFLLNGLGISPLAFALGMYLPLHLNSPLIVGGFLAHIVQKSSKNPAISAARHQRGTLISSGFIAGAAIFGVIGALIRFFGFDLNMGLYAEGDGAGQVVAIFAFFAIIAYMLWDIWRAKPEH